jgi:hypothetical protein
MRKLLLTAALLTMLVLQGQAQSQTKKEKIKSLFAVMHQDSLIIKTLDAMSSSMAKNNGEKHVNIVQRYELF